MVTDADRFERVMVTRADAGVPKGTTGVLMDVFPAFVIIESPPPDEGSAPGVWVVARNAVARADAAAA